MICRAWLIATPSGRLSQKRFTKKDTGSKLYRVSWLFLTGIVTSISCAFSTRSSLLQILRTTSRLHSVLMIFSLSSVTNLSLFFGFCAACMLSYRCFPMEWWATVTLAAIPSQPALLMWPCVSAARMSVLLPRASRAIPHSRHPADCILPILVRKLPIGVILVTAIPKRLLRFNGICFSHKYFPNIVFSCILSQHQVRYPSAEKGWWMPPLFFFSLIYFLNVSSSIHVPCRRAVTIFGS